jgi:hypothetical protein
MRPWTRKSDAGDLDNLARKARRRGDAAQAVLWHRALHLRLRAYDDAHASNERQWKFYNKAQSLRAIEEELERLRRYASWRPQQIERAKAAETAETSSA